jgi:16S rRNA (guanine966-N2)-methyltransferase
VRIVAGTWRGRRIRPPDDVRVRPTADRVREAWMSILQTDLPDARALDLFAGSGALGLEALSRGATSVVFVESAEKSLRALEENIAALGAQDRATVRRADACDFILTLGPLAFDVAFADPPYRMDLAGRVAGQWLTTPFARVLGVEHASAEHLPPGGDTRRYGDSAITFYRAPD